MYLCTCRCLSVEAKAQPWVLLFRSCHLGFGDAVSHWDLSSLISLGFSGQQAPGNSLCLFPQMGDCECVSTCLDLGSISGSHACRVGQVLTGCGRLSSLPSPLPPVILGQQEYEAGIGKPKLMPNCSAEQVGSLFYHDQCACISCVQGPDRKFCQQHLKPPRNQQEHFLADRWKKSTGLPSVFAAPYNLLLLREELCMSLVERQIPPPVEF